MAYRNRVIKKMIERWPMTRLEVGKTYMVKGQWETKGREMSQICKVLEEKKRYYIVETKHYKTTIQKQDLYAELYKAKRIA